MTALTPSPDAVIRLRGQLGFAQAMRASTEAAVRLYRGDRILNALLSDRARALFPHVALYLHFAGERDGELGLTVGAMKEMCARLDLCSGGRCEAMLALMRAAGFVASAPHLDRRRRPLVPTDRLTALHRDRWGVQFDAMSAVIPAAVAYRAALSDPAFVKTFVLELGRRFIAGLRVLDGAPELGPFAERTAGMVILFSLAQGGGADQPFPPDGPVPLSINALATRFSVSRKHVLTLLRDAEEQGLLVRGGAGNDALTILPRGREAIERMLATMFLYMAECAEVALQAAGREARASGTVASLSA
ncbi:hypothetical protein SSBR45G_27410 [Bradyrhizobium sp. SSBR45G]|uniref:hypothetical protein n=1 Tax=unclassified Bradyrhizobium TaxID=2631580 RepID=UPI002342B936|nr:MULTISPECIES: hypothetical protein [unclassified Bradyrhizobium]GLH77833.1 hypothetical protein SSBR45G_27410 [Bradyrhizobium sp. SSBR45G]GLH85545.1 hypothetical protein SSBR45R_30050 [Bradyrhizobium sp. SSBR45R]